MSIWCSQSHIGTDPTDGMWHYGDGTPVPPEGAQRGNVLSYAEGFSNHYPNLDGTHERPAVIATATVPHWCVPGVNEGDYDYDAAGPWLRLEVVAPEALNFWEKDADGNPKVEQRDATVLLDEEAARSLRDDLTAWLERPKAHPQHERHERGEG